VPWARLGRAHSSVGSSTLSRSSDGRLTFRIIALALFFLIFGLGACFGWETGYAINLARDFGPRLMSCKTLWFHLSANGAEVYHQMPSDMVPKYGVREITTFGSLWLVSTYSMATIVNGR